MYSSIIDAWDRDPVKEMTNKISKSTITHSDALVSLSNITDNLSLDTGLSCSDSAKLNTYSPYAPVKRRKTRDKCYSSMKHIKKCDKCFSKLRKMINEKVIEKFDTLVLDKRLNTPTTDKIPEWQVRFLNNSNSWKETLIIVSGVIITILLIFLIVKCLCK